MLLQCLKNAAVIISPINFNLRYPYNHWMHSFSIKVGDWYYYYCFVYFSSTNLFKSKRKEKCWISFITKTNTARHFAVLADLQVSVVLNGHRSLHGPRSPPRYKLPVGGKTWINSNCKIVTHENQLRVITEKKRKELCTKFYGIKWIIILQFSLSHAFSSQTNAALKL